MRMTAISPFFSVSTIATTHSPLLTFDGLPARHAAHRPGLALGWRRGYSSATKHARSKRRNAHVARIDDGPTAPGFERDRLRSRGVSERRDRLADGRGRAPPLRLRPGAPPHRPARQYPAAARGEARRSRRHAGL